MLAPWTAAIAVFNLGSAAGFSLLVVLVIDVHGGSEIAFGATLTAAGVAGVAGASLAPRLVRRFGRGPVLLTCAFSSAAVMTALSIAPALWFVVGVWGVGGALSGTLLAIGRGFVQRHCPDELIGRAAIASRTITRTSFVIGALAGGALATTSGPPAAFAAGAAAQAAALPLMALAFRHDD